MARCSTRKRGKPTELQERAYSSVGFKIALLAAAEGDETARDTLTFSASPYFFRGRNSQGPLEHEENDVAGHTGGREREKEKERIHIGTGVWELLLSVFKGAEKRETSGSWRFGREENMTRKRK